MQFVSFGAFIYGCVKRRRWGYSYIVLCCLHVLGCRFDCVDLVGCAKAMVMVVNK